MAQARADRAVHCWWRGSGHAGQPVKMAL